MLNKPNFYSVIIGTELLNGRRNDAHFSFINNELIKRGWEQKANFVIEDDPSFIEDVLRLIKKDKNSVLFCFGGIGSTPDDYTRKCAANVFTSSKMQYNKTAQNLILNKFGKESYPYRIEMSHLPIDSKLLDNPINQIPGFYIENRFFFVPGFPNMAHPMIKQALDTYYLKSEKKHRLTLIASCSENELIPIMKKLPKTVEFSSLPKMIDDRKKVEISIASCDKSETKKYFKLFVTFLVTNSIPYVLVE